jgi:N-acetyltransferase 10
LQDLVPRFNERFLLSLKDMAHCLMLDDTLDVLPWARQTRARVCVCVCWCGTVC